VGGGVELAIACDILIAASTAELFLPEASLGAMADAGGVQRLPRQLPPAVVMDLLLTGRRMSATEAARFGLVSRLVAPDELSRAMREVAQVIADNAPLAVQAIKEVLAATQSGGVRDAYDAVRSGALPIYERMKSSADRREGPRAFAEKRRPRFTGR
jgi:crotonobetainyl-CoA hydratase